MQESSSKVNASKSAAVASGYSLRLIGRTLQVLGGLSSFLFLIGGQLFWRLLGLRMLALGLASFASLLLGSYLHRLGKRLSVKDAEDLMREDSRNPVLYLRSFADDRVAAQLAPGDPQLTTAARPLADAFTTDSEEEVLANELNRIGPCVAVGIPGERLPRLGASRLYFEDAEWREGVQELMGRSELVVMRAGVTEGFLLELEMAVALVDPRKLIILLPFETEKKFLRPHERQMYSQFREVANRILPKELPAFSGIRMPGSSLSGVIHFRADWTPEVLALSEVGSTVKESLETIAKRYSNYGRI